MHASECTETAYWQRGVQPNTGVAHFHSGFAGTATLPLAHQKATPRMRSHNRRLARKKNEFQRGLSFGDEHLLQVAKRTALKLHQHSEQRTSRTDH